MALPLFRAAALAALAAVVLGCAGGKKPDYREHRVRPPLTVPPDLTPPAADADLSAALAGNAFAAAQPAPGEAPPTLALAKAELDTNTGVLTVHEDLAPAWESVGKALDRVGAAIDDKDRAQGVYAVRYNGAAPADAKRGFFSRWFKATTQAVDAPLYRVNLERAGDDTAVRVTPAAGVPSDGDRARRLLEALYQQLK